MAVSRRQWLGSVALTVGCNTVAEGAETAISLEALRNLSAAQGTNFSDARLRVIKPVLEQRLSQLHTLRNFEVDDNVAPTQGILDK
jgi:hypothetical protein